MEKETRLILEALEYLIAMERQPQSERYEEKLYDLQSKIYLALNPIGEKTLPERTHDVLKEEGESK